MKMNARRKAGRGTFTTSTSVSSLSRTGNSREKRLSEFVRAVKVENEAGQGYLYGKRKRRIKEERATRWEIVPEINAPYHAQ